MCETIIHLLLTGGPDFRYRDLQPAGKLRVYAGCDRHDHQCNLSRCDRQFTAFGLQQDTFEKRKPFSERLSFMKNIFCLSEKVNSARKLKFHTED